MKLKAARSKGLINPWLSRFNAFPNKPWVRHALHALLARNPIKERTRTFCSLVFRAETHYHGLHAHNSQENSFSFKTQERHALTDCNLEIQERNALTRPAVLESRERTALLVLQTRPSRLSHGGEGIKSTKSRGSPHPWPNGWNLLTHI